MDERWGLPRGICGLPMWDMWGLPGSEPWYGLADRWSSLRPIGDGAMDRGGSAICGYPGFDVGGLLIPCTIDCDIGVVVGVGPGVSG